jgi:hypothetical protein
MRDKDSYVSQAGLPVQAGIANPQGIRMVVVFPAPFGPRKPKISPRRIRRSIESTAVIMPNRFVRPWASITMFVRIPFPSMEVSLFPKGW